MRFRLVEDKILTISDSDYATNEYDLKYFLDSKGVKYKIKDADTNQEISNKSSVENDKDMDAYIDSFKTDDPKVMWEFISKFNNNLAHAYVNDKKALSDIYDVFYHYNASDKFSSFIQENGKKFIDKLDSLKTFANLVGGDRFSEKSLKHLSADDGFFNESDEDVTFKLKAIALLDDEDLRNKWFGKENELDTIDILGRNGKFITAEEMNTMLAEQESKAHKQGRIKNDKPNEDPKKLAAKEKAKAYRQDARQRKKIDSQEEQKVLNKTQGYTGKDILLKLLKKNGVKKPDKQSIYDYTKSLVKESSMPAMSDSISKMIDNGDFDDELEKVLSQRYKSNLDKDSSNLFKHAVIKALNDGIDKVAHPESK